MKKIEKPHHYELSESDLRKAITDFVKDNDLDFKGEIVKIEFSCDVSRDGDTDNFNATAFTAFENY